MGFRCGYVKVPEGHPWHGLEYEEANTFTKVYGGLTFAEPDVPCDQEGDDNGYWFGFDAAHSGDLPDPSLPCDDDPSYWGLKAEFDIFESLFVFKGDSTVKDADFIRKQCISLCEQASKGVVPETSPVCRNIITGQFTTGGGHPEIPFGGIRSRSIFD